MSGAFGEWVAALASDADAALGFAAAYRELEGPARGALLDALDVEIAARRLPAEAVYAPVLAVELDDEGRGEPDADAVARRERAHHALARIDRPRARAHALRGDDPSGVSVLCLVQPVYLGFASVLSLGLRARDIVWTEADLLREAQRAPKEGDVLRGARLRDADPMRAIEEIAHAIVATTRAGNALPPRLRAFADLFSMPALVG